MREGHRKRPRRRKGLKIYNVTGVRLRLGLEIVFGKGSPIESVRVPKYIVDI